MKKLLRKSLAALAVALFALPAMAQKYVGGDISLLPEYEKAGSQYYDEDGKAITDVLAYLKKEGWNALRVRLFVDPSNYDGSDKANVCQNLEYVKTLGKRIKDAGFKFMLDFHYSDGWADPANQWTPKAWLSLNDGELETKIYEYTKDALQQLKDAGATPDFVQTGNEISYGMLWGEKKDTADYVCYPSSSLSNWTRFTNLLKYATKATREVLPDAKIILHVERVSISQQKDNENYGALKYFFRKMFDAGIDYDIIGLSYYPYFHGPMNELDGAISYLEKSSTNKDIMIVETGYPYAWAVEGSTYDYTYKYPYSDDGQEDFTEDLIEMLGKHKNVKGLFWWWPEYNAKGTNLQGWYNAPLFDSRTGKATSALTEMEDFVKTSTGIKTLKRNSKTIDEAYYNLSGQRVSKPHHGLYIHNEKKIILK